MKKEEFMNKLESCLQEISYEERQSALQYYEEYFEEAGADETAVEQLDSPEKIAKAIKEDLDIRLQTVRSRLEKERTDNHTKNNQSKEENNKSHFNSSQHEKQETLWDKAKNYWSSMDKKTRDILTIVAACLLLSSIVSNGFRLMFDFPFGGGFHIFGWIFSMIGVIIGLTVAGYAMTLSGIVLFIVSIVTMFASVIHGLFLMGTSFLLIGFGMFFISGTLWFWSTLVPQLIQTISKLFRGKKEVSQ